MYKKYKVRLTAPDSLVMTDNAITLNVTGIAPLKGVCHEIFDLHFFMIRTHPGSCVHDTAESKF